jgi:hypothetical protein
VSYGARIGVRANDPYVIEKLQDQLQLRFDSPDVSDVDVLYSVRFGQSTNSSSWNLFKGSEFLASTAEIAGVLGRLESDIHLEVALHARTGVFVHAGVVEWNGQAILVPGRSFAGKSTLVAALVRHGAVYYSDEYAVIDAFGLVHPYLKPISLRLSDGRTRKIGLTELGTRVGSEPIPVGTVVSAKYRHGATWKPRRISEARTLLHLLDNTVVAQLKPEFALLHLTRVASRAVGWKGLRGDAEETATALLEHCGPRILDKSDLLRVHK